MAATTSHQDAHRAYQEAPTVLDKQKPQNLNFNTTQLMLSLLPRW